MVQWPKCGTVNATVVGSILICGNDVFNNFISSLWQRGNVRRRVPPHNTQCLGNLGVSGVRSVLTLWLHHCMWCKVKKVYVYKNICTKENYKIGLSLKNGSAFYYWIFFYLIILNFVYRTSYRNLYISEYYKVRLTIHKKNLTTKDSTSTFI